jgi:pimeloyl-ACP methyl ester carboxylesterase
MRHPGIARAIVNDAGYDCLNPQASSFAMRRQMLGGSPEGTEADPDTAAAFFASQPEMASMFELMRADQDAGGGPGYWRTYLTTAFERATRWPGYSFGDLATIDVPTPVLVGDRDHFCTAEEGVTTYRHLKDGQLAIVPNTGHVIHERRSNCFSSSCSVAPRSRADAGCFLPSAVVDASRFFSGLAP